MIALASKRAVITIVDVAYLCNIAVILFVIIIAVVARAAYATVCIIVKHIAASSDENIIGCFCGYGSVGNNDFGTVCKGDCNNKFVLAGAGYIVVLKGEICGGRAIVDVAIGKRYIILIPLIAVFECSIFGDSAGLNGNRLFKIVINRAAQRELYLRGLDFALLEQLVVSCKGYNGSVADRSIGYIAVFINKVPAEVLEAVYIARRRKIAVFLAIGYSDGCKLASAVAVKGYGIGVCFPLCNIGCICGYLFRNNRAPTGEGVAGAGGSSVECGSCFVLFCLHGNIRKGFAVYAIGIGYLIVTVKEELCACTGGIIVAVNQPAAEGTDNTGCSVMAESVLEMKNKVAFAVGIGIASERIEMIGKAFDFFKACTVFFKVGFVYGNSCKNGFLFRIPSALVNGKGSRNEVNMTEVIVSVLAKNVGYANIALCKCGSFIKVLGKCDPACAEYTVSVNGFADRSGYFFIYIVPSGENISCAFGSAHKCRNLSAFFYIIDLLFKAVVRILIGYGEKLFPLCNIGYILGYLLRNSRLPTKEGIAGAGGSSVKFGGCFVVFYIIALVREDFFAIHAVGIGYLKYIFSIGYIYIGPAVYGGIIAYLVAVPIPVVPFIKSIALYFADACVSFKEFNKVASAEGAAGIDGLGICFIAVINSFYNNLFIIGNNRNYILPLAAYRNAFCFGIVASVFIVIEVAVIEPADILKAVCGGIIIRNVRGKYIVNIKIGNLCINYAFGKVGGFINYKMNIAGFSRNKAGFDYGAGFRRFKSTEVSEILHGKGCFIGDKLILCNIVPSREGKTKLRNRNYGSVICCGNLAVLVGICLEGLNIVGGAAGNAFGIGDIVAALARKLNVPVDPLIGFPLCIKDYIMSRHGHFAVHCIMSAAAVLFGVPTGLAVVGGVIRTGVLGKLLAVHCSLKVYFRSLIILGFRSVVSGNGAGKLVGSVAVKGNLIAGNRFPLCGIGYILGCFFRKCGLPTDEFVTGAFGGTGECRSFGACNDLYRIKLEHGIVRAVLISYINISRLYIFEVNRSSRTLFGIICPFGERNRVCRIIAGTFLINEPCILRKAHFCIGRRGCCSVSDIIALGRSGVCINFAAALIKNGNIIPNIKAAALFCIVCGNLAAVEDNLNSFLSSIFCAFCKFCADCAACLGGSVSGEFAAVNNKLCAAILRIKVDCAAVCGVTAGNNAGTYAVVKGDIHHAVGIALYSLESENGAAFTGYGFAVKVNGKVIIIVKTIINLPKNAYGFGGISEKCYGLRAVFHFGFRSVNSLLESGIFHTGAFKACNINALYFPLCGVGYISGYGFSNFGLPAFEIKALTHESAVECGGRISRLYIVGLIFEDFFILYAVGIGHFVCFYFSLKVCGNRSLTFSRGAADNNFSVGGLRESYTHAVPIGKAVTAGTVKSFKSDCAVTEISACTLCSCCGSNKLAVLPKLYIGITICFSAIAGNPYEYAPLHNRSI